MYDVFQHCGWVEGWPFKYVHNMSSLQLLYLLKLKNLYMEWFESQIRPKLKQK